MILDPSALTTWLLGILPAVVDFVTSYVGTGISSHGDSVWDDINGSLQAANFLTRTPPEMSYNLGGVSDLYRAWEPALFGIVTLSCVLAGAAALGREYFGWSWAPGEYGARLFLGALLVLIVPRIYIFSIDLLNRIDGAIEAAALPNVPSGAIDPITSAVLVIVWIVLGIRVLWRMAYRLVYLDVILVLGPLAMMCWVIPGGEQYARFWARTFIGLLVGQIFVVVCLKLASAIAGPSGSTWGGIALGIGVLLLAHDMATLLVDIKGGGLVGVVRTTIALARGLKA